MAQEIDEQTAMELPARPTGFGFRLIRALIVIWTIYCLIDMIYVTAMLNSPQAARFAWRMSEGLTFGQTEQEFIANWPATGRAWTASFLAIYYSRRLFWWVLPTVALGVIALLFRRSSIPRSP